jgi:hypothetical protein
MLSTTRCTNRCVVFDTSSIQVVKMIKSGVLYATAILWSGYLEEVKDIRGRLRLQSSKNDLQLVARVKYHNHT